MNCSITVLYNPSKEELNNISSYSSYVDNIIIVDNSKESHENEIRNMINNNLEFIHYPNNIGLCSAMNEAMKIAKSKAYKWALLMDSDSRLNNNIIKSYEDYLEMTNDDKIAILAPVHIFDRSNNHEYQGAKKLDWAMTSGCYYNVDIFEAWGGFLDELFVDGLDIEYGYKVNKQGYKIIEIGNVSIMHHPAETKTIKLFNKIIFKYGYASPWRYFMKQRCLVYCIFKYKAYKLLINYLYAYVKVILFFPNKIDYLKEMHKGTKTGLILAKQE